MSSTYTVILTTSTMWVGAGSEDEIPLSDFGYTDEEWDSLEEGERMALINDWAEDNFWNMGYEFHGEVV